MHKIGIIMVALFTGLFVLGCGKSNTDSNNSSNDSINNSSDDVEIDVVSATAIQVMKDGSIKETVTEKFSKDYYDEDNLRNMILSEVAEFNKDSEEDISVEKIEDKKGIITVTMQYPSADIYTEYNKNKYNNKAIFCGTIKDAYDAGYSLDVSLKNIKNEEEHIGKEEILNMGEKYILISGEPIHVQTFGKILYVGENVFTAGKDQADMNYNDEDKDQKGYYLIFK